MILSEEIKDLKDKLDEVIESGDIYRDSIIAISEKMDLIISEYMRLYAEKEDKKCNAGND